MVSTAFTGMEKIEARLADLEERLDSVDRSFGSVEGILKELKALAQKRRLDFLRLEARVEKFAHDESEEPELKPCPFCGGRVEMVDRDNGFFFECAGPAGGAEYECGDWEADIYRRDAAIEAWNRRAGE